MMSKGSERRVVRANHRAALRGRIPASDNSAPMGSASIRLRKADRPLCGARTRAGRPCHARCVWDYQRQAPRNGRCRMHGGCSTGPKTPEGQQRAIEAMQKGHRRWRDRQHEGEFEAELEGFVAARPPQVGRMTKQSKF